MLTLRHGRAASSKGCYLGWSGSAGTAGYRPATRYGWSLAQPAQIWANDITCIRPHEDWLYLATVIDLYSQAVVGWSMNSTMAMKLVLNAMTVAV